LEGRDADGPPAWVFELVTGWGGRIMKTGLEPFMNLAGVGQGETSSESGELHRGATDTWTKIRLLFGREKERSILGRQQCPP